MESITPEAEKFYKAILYGFNTNVKLASKFKINGEAASSRARRLRNKGLIKSKWSKKTIKGQKYFIYSTTNIMYIVSEKNETPKQPTKEIITIPDYIGNFLYPFVIITS